jgi:hypothetical protein
MKHLPHILLAIVAAIGLLTLYACGTTEFGRQLATGIGSIPDSTILNTIPGNPEVYLVTPRFDRIDRVVLIAKDGSEKDRETPLSAADWAFSPGSDRLTLTNPVDPSRFAVRIWGPRQDPWVATATEPIDPLSIRLAIDGRIGIRDKDYFPGKDGHSIIVPSFDSARFSLKYRFGHTYTGSGPSGEANLTRQILKYFDYPLSGNFALDAAPATYHPKSDRFESVWSILLIPVREDETGRILDNPSDWKFDPATQELTILSPRDLARFEVYAWGKALSNVSFLPAVRLNTNGREFQPLQRLEMLYGVEVQRVDDWSRPARPLEPGEWSFDPQTQILALRQPIDAHQFILLLRGERSTPVSFQHTQPIDPASVRFVYDGRIAQEGQDYRLGDDKRSLTVLIDGYPDSPAPNKLVYRLVGAAKSPEDPAADTGGNIGNIGPGNLYKLAPALVRYLGTTAGYLWESIPGQAGAYRNPEAKTLRFTRLETVEMASLVDGQPGRLLQAGEWSFDAKSQILRISPTPAEGRWVVQAWGKQE